LLGIDVCLEKRPFCWYNSFTFLLKKSRDLLTALGCVVSKNINDVDYQFTWWHAAWCQNFHTQHIMALQISMCDQLSNNKL